MVGATDCNYYRMMGSDWLGEQYKEGNYTRQQVQDILMSCYGITTPDAIADWFNRFVREDPPPPPDLPPPADLPEPGDDDFVGPIEEPPADLPEPGDDDFVGPIDDPDFYEDEEIPDSVEVPKDSLLIVLGAIVLGMVLYYTVNTTKEAL